VFCRLLFFSVVHCIPFTSIYYFWLLLWYIQTTDLLHAQTLDTIKKKYQKVKGRKHAHRLYYGHFCKFYSSEMIFTSISSKHVRSIELPMFHDYKVIFTRLGHRANFEDCSVCTALVMNYSRFGDTTDTDKSASYLDLHF
jgi:hypothetical protein